MPAFGSKNDMAEFMTPEQRLAALENLEARLGRNTE
jgi:hypothetical protein